MTILYIILATLAALVLSNVLISIFPLKRIIIRYKKGRHLPTVMSIIKAWWFMGFWQDRTFNIVPWTMSAVNYVVSPDVMSHANKIVGRTHGIKINARKGSTRIGWRRTENGMDYQTLQMIEGPPKNYDFTFYGPYKFHLVSDPITVKGFGRPTFPHFGGRDPAPKDITMEVRRT